MSEKHTRGPWVLFSDERSKLLEVLPAMRPGTIAKIIWVHAGDEGDEEAYANARLIAAAPDLLAACELALAAMGNMSAAEVVRAALAKSRGE